MPDGTDIRDTPYSCPLAFTSGARHCELYGEVIPEFTDLLVREGMTSLAAEDAASADVACSTVLKVGSETYEEAPRARPQAKGGC